MIQPKEKDETILFEKNDTKYYCELEVSVNCIELILLGLIGDKPSGTGEDSSPMRHSINLKKIITSLVEDVASHAIVIEYPPVDQRSLDVVDASPPLAPFKAIDKEQFTTITESSELHFVPVLEDEDGTICKPVIRLVQSSLKRNIKRRKAKPRYPDYIWLLSGPNKKRIVPPKHATDFYYRLLEGNVGYPLNYLGAAIKDLASRGIIETAGKRLTLSCEEGESVERLFDREKVKGAIRWKVRVGHKKDHVKE